MPLPKLHILLDNSPGLGHRTRTMAIAERWMQRGGKVRTGPPENHIPCVTLFDGYSFVQSDFDEQSRNLTMLFDDGYIYNSADVDIIINYVPGMPRDIIYTSTDRALLGPRYFPASSFVVKAIPKSRDNGKIFDTIKLAGHQLTPSDFVRRMTIHRAVICSASVKAFEALALGKILLIQTMADNQKVITHQLLSGNYALKDTPENRQKVLDMPHNSVIQIRALNQALVDGKGVDRIIDVIEEEWEKKNGN